MTPKAKANPKGPKGKEDKEEKVRPEVKSKAKAKAKASPKDKGKKTTVTQAKKEKKDKKTEAEVEDTKVEAPEDQVLKKPAAKTSPKKRPATQSNADPPASKVRKATKYLYHAEGKWGIKLDGRELGTAAPPKLFNQGLVHQSCSHCCCHFAFEASLAPCGVRIVAFASQLGPENSWCERSNIGRNCCDVLSVAFVLSMSHTLIVLTLSFSSRLFSLPIRNLALI